jgi:steroid 5-alpha reductase family enzyme
MSPLATTLLVSLAVVSAALTLLWVVSVARRDASIIDPFWGTGFAIVALLSCWLNQPVAARSVLLTALCCVWGLRLSIFLLARNWGHGEDRRYQAMRAYQGPRFWWLSLFSVFLLQAVLLWIVSLPIQVAASSAQAAPISWLDVLGAGVWAIGFCFETVGDWQLAQFKASPHNQGRVMDRGLWRLTRHPNYFGDFCVWWGLYLIAASGGAWWTVFSPLLMSVLLMRVSGVTLLEKTITDRRPDYAAYQARTNAFFPGWPRKS